MNQNIFIGQVLYREIFNRRAPSEIKEFTVCKIGKKYLYLKESDRYAINKETLMYDDKNYSQCSFQVYRTKEEILERWERGRLIDKIRKTFDWMGNQKFTIEQLREVAKILELQ